MSTNEWYKDIQREITRRDKLCQTRFSPLNRYKLPIENPYNYPDVDTFIAEHPFKNKPTVNECTVVKPQVARAQSTDNTYYVNATNPAQCKYVGGVWDATAVNRRNKYDSGVCWVTAQDGKCAKQANPDLLRPYTVRRLSATDLETQRSVSERKCNAQHGCEFKQTGTYSFDCLDTAKAHAADNESVVSEEAEPVFNKCIPVTESKKRTYELVTPDDFHFNNFLNKVETTQNRIKQLDPIKNYSALSAYTTQPLLDQYVAVFNRGTKQPINYAKFFPKWFKYDFARHIEDLRDEDLNVNTTTLTPQQRSVYKQVKKPSQNRGLLIWHSTGSGKTCIATGIIDAYWDTPREILYVSSLNALASNPPFKFEDCGTRFYDRFKTPSPTTIEQRVSFTTYTKVANRYMRGELDVNNCVFILDEAQNLFSPLPHQRTPHKQLLSVLLDTVNNPGCKIYILTATPGATRKQLVHLLNLVRNPAEPKIQTIDKAQFRSSITGLVSYFDMSGDTSAFPVLYDNPPTHHPMSRSQFYAYLEKRASVQPSQMQFKTLAAANQLEKYWAPARKYSNTKFLKDNYRPLSDFSSKLPALLANIAAHPNEKHYVYSAFYERRGYGGHGIRAIANELKQLKYKQLTAPTTTTDKRYIMAISTEISDNDEFQQLVDTYNSPENKHGDLVHVFLASQRFNEGLDLKDVRHIHIFEPLISWTSDRQLVGRAVRYCSHANLSKEDGEWTVEVHRYFADPPTSLKGDMLAHKYAQIDLMKYKRKELKEIMADLHIPFYSGYLKNELVNLIAPFLINDYTITMIDEQIYNESRLRAADLETLYAIVKDVGAI